LELPSSPVPWLVPEDASPSVVAGLGSFFVAGFPELVASLLEELSCPAAVDVPGQE
jgi:hypothetical protein